MSPRETTFNRENVMEAGITIVREKGWANLTARAIANKLKASVAPVYSTFGSMDSLQREILQEARRLLHEKTTVAYTEDSFLNIGVGMVVFARDEGYLFQALFHTRHHYSDIIEGIFSSILERMKGDLKLRLLSDTSLERLLDNLGTYTLGLASSIVYGRIEDASTEAIIRRLKDAGNMMILGEVMGTADCESRENNQVWERLFAENQFPPPPPEGDGGGNKPKL
jgi:AcrR family transcriptional regulator